MLPCAAWYGYTYGYTRSAVARAEPSEIAGSARKVVRDITRGGVDLCGCSGAPNPHVLFGPRLIDGASSPGDFDDLVSDEIGLVADESVGQSICARLYVGDDD